MAAITTGRISGERQVSCSLLQPGLFRPTQCMGTTRTIPGVSVAFISHQIGLGPRVYLGSERVRPFLDALFCPTEVHFGGAGSGRVRGGFQTNLGVRTYVGRRFAL